MFPVITGLTVTVALAFAGVVPDAPVQVTVNIVLAVRTPEEILVPVRPVCQAEPALVTLHEVALAEVHEMLDVPPDVIEVGLAVMETVGLIRLLVKVAITVVLAVGVKVQEVAVTQLPALDQAVKDEPEAGVAVRVIELPGVTLQFTGLQVTVPVPVPSLLTVTV